MRLDDAVTYFLHEWPAEGSSPHTVRTYTEQLTWLSGWAADSGKLHLAQLTPSLLRAAMAARMDRGATTHSVNYRGGEASAHSLAHATRALARWLLAQNVSVADLTVVKIPRVPERVQPRLQPQEFNLLETAILRRLVEGKRRVPRVAMARDLALIYFLADTGLRASEVCSLDIRSIDFERGCVHVIRGKGNKERQLSLVDPSDPQGGATLRLLHEWIEARATVPKNAKHQQLWTSVRGSPLSQQELRRVLFGLCQDAGIDGSRPPHAFRRAAFTEGYKANPAAVQILAARMGWSPRSHHMQDVYTRGANMDMIASTPMVAVSGLLRQRDWPAGQPEQRPAGPARPIRSSQQVYPTLAR